MLHVVGDVLAEDVAAVHLGAELLLLAVVAGETLLGVRNVDSAVGGALHRAENLGSGGSAGQTDVQTSAEGARPIIDVLDHEVLAIDVLLSLVDSVQLELLENATRQEQTGAVGGRVVGQADLDAVVGQLVAVGRGHNLVSVEARIGDLTANVPVRGAHDHAVLGGVILVLVLHHQTLAGEVVGLAFPAPAELDLVALEVRLVLD